MPAGGVQARVSEVGVPWITKVMMALMAPGTKLTCWAVPPRSGLPGHRVVGGGVGEGRVGGQGGSLIGRLVADAVSACGLTAPLAPPPGFPACS